MKRFWLVKSEPSVYSIDDLAREGQTYWNGVRNHQAKNFMAREMRKGDPVLFYHSSCEPPGIVGLASVAREGYPDFTAWDPDSPYYDPVATPDEPRWWMVDIRFERKFSRLLSLDDLKSVPELQDMQLLNRSRLSVQPVEIKHFDVILKLVDK